MEMSMLSKSRINRITSTTLRNLAKVKDVTLTVKNLQCIWTGHEEEKKSNI